MCFGGREDGGEVKRSRDIDAMIHRDEKVMQRQVKLLLLGMCVCVFDHHSYHLLLAVPVAVVVAVVHRI